MGGFDLDRMCRLDGKQPTARERWTAFYRLWRLANGQGGHQDIAVGECFRVLFRRWDVIRLVEDAEVIPSRVGAPTFLRKILLAHDKRKRLGFPDTERMQRVARRVRDEHGVELTPDEIAEHRMRIIRKMRDVCMAEGVPVPADDDQLWEDIVEAIHRKDRNDG